MESRVLYKIMCAMMSLIFAMSCSESEDVIDTYVDNYVDNSVDNYLDVEISTLIEATYSDEVYGRSESSFEVDNATYDMRYKIELWSGDLSEVIYSYEEVKAEISASLTHSFRAIAGDYRLVIFADYVVTEDGEVTKSYYTTSNDLDEIMISKSEDGDYAYEANNSSRDCYGYSKDITIDSSFSLSDITLKRPMAKMTLADVAPANVTSDTDVEITYNTSIPCGYDLLNGAVIIDEDEAVTVSYSATTEVGQETLAYDYIFISAPTSYLMTFKVGEKEVSSTINFEQNVTTNITATFFEAD